MTAVVLLILTGHAFVVSASHFHRGRQPFTAASTREARVGLPDAAQSAPLAGGHEQCLLCRLQRNLVADLSHATPTLGAPRAATQNPDRLFHAHVRQPALLAPPGRAPPSA
jgi:hypothetical protein